MQQAIQKAIAAYQSGNAAEAVKQCEWILSQDPHHLFALSVLGAVYVAQARLEPALQTFTKVAELRPDDASAHSNRGVVLQQLGRYDEALASYERAVKLKPDYAEAFYNRGAVLQQLKRYAQALASCQRAVELKPDYAEAWGGCGVALLELQRFDEALASCQRAVELKPAVAEAHYNLGNVLQKLQQHEQALAAYARALELRPNFAQAQCNRGNVLRAMKRFDEALVCYQSAVDAQPDYVDAWVNRGNVLKDLGRAEDALASCQQALTLQADSAAALSGCGLALQALKRFDEAVACYEQALAITPDDADVLHNYGMALHDCKRFDDALQTYQRALEHKPEHAPTWLNRGVTLKKQQRFREALAAYQKAVDAQPDYADAYWNKSLLHLLLGEYEQGWSLYEWRWQRDERKRFARNFTQPLWLGEQDVRGKTVLIHSEQGFGDVIHFARYAPRIEALGARVVFEAFPPLVKLLSTLSETIRVVPWGDAPTEFDYQIPVMSLPLAFKTTLETIYAPQTYLSVDAAKHAVWKERLGPKTQRRIGIAWSGNAAQPDDVNRSMSLDMLRPLLDTGAEIHCLQKDIRPADRELLAQWPQVRVWSDELQDFTDTAALTVEMDLVVSVCTSLAHLAGALGKPVWVMLAHTACFRWLTERDDSPWYPSARLFRQPSLGGWSSVVARVRDELLAGA